ncbi:DUF2161 domain-containing phosphodiesterase [Litoreibacter roseus]|uniref:Uncharacterized protein n=1 Tax=Litoreibacter roseus TaxID=2601869 RepID=A0A6N6JJ43_9RHOB|nr:DUF2161 family putative PD-(D/E)XK-type phosphodiesterase [Litoreibacter roseus]GFE65288.1 hypothetical protein KIN_23620 [Litoreibacter roseus]
MTNQKSPREVDLYPPIKMFLEDQGFDVKAEVGPCDVMACRGDDDPVIVELKLGFSLSLVHQAIARQSVCDDVYLAVPRQGGKRFGKSLKDMKMLCRRLGLGLITVRLSDGLVEVHQDPAPYAPRKSKLRKGRLLREFAKRVGDPNTGGAVRTGLVTAYRQDAMKCANFLGGQGASKGARVAKETGVIRATRIMADNHYGWFERVEIGIYDLTPAGRKELPKFSALLPGK